MAAIFVLILVALVVLFVASSVVSVPVRVGVVLKLAHLCDLAYGLLCGLCLLATLDSSWCTGEGVLEKSCAFIIDGTGELDLESDEEVSHLIGALVEGHAKTLASEN